MFDELKEVQYFQETKRFDEPEKVKYFEEIKGLKSLQVKADGV